MTKRQPIIKNNSNISDWPMALPCPDGECQGRLNIKIGDIETGKIVECPICHKLTKLNSSE